VIVLFYLLKRKRVIRLVSSTLLWQKYLADTQANAPFQKLRRNWLLLLQILLIAFAVLALVRPYRAGQARPTRLRVIVLDGSRPCKRPTKNLRALRRLAPKPCNGWMVARWRTDDDPLCRRDHRGQTVAHLRQNRPASRPPILWPSDSNPPGRRSEDAGAFTYEKRGEEEVTSGEIHLFSDGAFPPLAELETAIFRSFTTALAGFGQRRDCFCRCADAPRRTPPGAPCL